MTPHHQSTAPTSQDSRMTAAQRDQAIAAGIYCRISDDPSGLALGVQRQLTDCTSEVERRQWALSKTYTDNDVSATRSKTRPEYERMLADARRGNIQAIVVWDVDRLTRTPRELEDVIDIADQTGVQLVSIGGEIDLSTTQGRLTARIKGSVARAEAEAISRRVRRKIVENAEAGLPHGRVAYGYKRVADVDDRGRKVGAHEELYEPEAEVIRYLADAVLSGQSLRSLVVELNTAGSDAAVLLNHGQPVPTVGGGKTWRTTQIRHLLQRERNAGRYVHQGVVTDVVAAWPCIYQTADGQPDPGVHDQVVAVLTDPTRKTNYAGSTRRYLLTGIAHCGRCRDGGQIVVSHGKRNGVHYKCRACNGVVRKVAPVEDLVRQTMLAAFRADPEFLARLAAGDADLLAAAQRRKAGLEAKLQRLADAFADDVDTDPAEAVRELIRVRARLRPRIAQEEAIIEANRPAALPAALLGPTAVEAWDVQTLDVRREVVRQVLSVTLMPSPRRGPGFDPATVRQDWLI